jgi:hypothetical protein
VLQQAQWFGWGEAPASPTEVTENRSPDLLGSLPRDPVRPDPIAPSPRDREETPVERFDLYQEARLAWEEAVRGDEPGAYERLTALARERPGQEDLYLRIHWLLTVRPELDPARCGAHWLVEGLAAGGPAGRLREVYRQELLADPAEALSERFERLLGPSVPALSLAESLEWRWQAALRLGAWKTLTHDLDAFRDRFRFQQEAAWLHLVLLLVEGVAWEEEGDGRALLDACLEEIDQLEDLALRHAHEFDRLDFLMAVASGWRTLRGQEHFQPEFLQLIFLSWSRPLAELRALAMTVLESIANDPDDWLDRLDGMEADASAVLAHFGRLLEAFAHDWGRSLSFDGDAPRAGRRVQEFLDGLEEADYLDLRSRMLSFCLREDLAPEDVAAAVTDPPTYWMNGDSLPGRLYADWPLRLIWQAVHLFWA